MEIELWPFLDPVVLELLSSLFSRVGQEPWRARKTTAGVVRGRTTSPLFRKTHARSFPRLSFTPRLAGLFQFLRSIRNPHCSIHSLYEEKDENRLWIERTFSKSVNTYLSNSLGHEKQSCGENSSTKQFDEKWDCFAGKMVETRENRLTKSVREVAVWRNCDCNWSNPVTLSFCPNVFAHRAHQRVNNRWEKLMEWCFCSALANSRYG